MMRINTGIFCALTSAIVLACSFGGSSSNPTPDSSTGGAAHCGDGVCAASEINNCPADCGGGGSSQNAVCGNGMCETTKGETEQSCPSDCMSQQGSGSGSSGGACPSDVTTCFGCAFTGTGCPPGLDMNGCLACIVGGLGSGAGSGAGCVGGVPNGVCDPGEDNMNCPFDCP